MDKFLKNLGSLVYEKAVEFKEVTTQVSELVLAAKSDTTIQSMNLESAFQGVIASMLGCVSNFTPPQTRNALAFWTLISNQDLDRWELSRVMNQHELIKLGDEVDNKKLSHYFDEIRSTLKICMEKKYYGGVIASMSTEEQKAILFEVLKTRGDDDKLLEIADEATEINKFQAAIDLIDYALLINPDNHQAKQKLLEIYPKAIQDVIDEGRYEDALSLTEKASELDTENAKTAALRETIKNHLQENKLLPIEKAKKYALEFIRKYYPEEEIYFEGFWGSLKDRKINLLRTRQFAFQGVALTGTMKKLKIEKLATPSTIVVMLFLKESLYAPSDLPSDNKLFEEINKLTPNSDLAKQLIDFVVHKYQL